MGVLKDLFRSKKAESNRRLMEWIISHIELGRNDRVLEVGFGLGALLQIAGKKVTGGMVTGIEVSKSMVKAASELNSRAIKAGRMEILHADANQLKYENDHFDKVFAVNVVYFWPDLTKTINELCRVIKPGGMIALYLAPKILMEEMKKTRLGHFTMFEPQEVEETLQVLGFNPIRIERVKSLMGIIHCVIGVQT